jgi:hypothetical protein
MQYYYEEAGLLGNQYKWISGSVTISPNGSGYLLPSLVDQSSIWGYGSGPPVPSKCVCRIRSVTLATGAEFLSGVSLPATADTQ